MRTEGRRERERAVWGLRERERETVCVRYRDERARQTEEGGNGWILKTRE